MAGFTFLMSAGRFGRTANIGTRIGFLYTLYYVGKAKQEAQAPSKSPAVPALVGKTLGAVSPLFFKPEKPAAEVTNEKITLNLDVISTTARDVTNTISAGGGAVVDSIYKPK